MSGNGDAGSGSYSRQATIRIDELRQAGERSSKRAPRKRPKNRSQLGSDFVAPDGGWGWVVVFAAGFSNLCTFPVLQQFGLLFRERMTELAIGGSEVTTIINTHSALTSIVGLANGPMFRRFTYRQVAFGGALLVAVAIMLTAYMDSFAGYMVTFAVLYGAGVGINASANSLALNTYFKRRRRLATGFTWTLTGLGPIVAPHLITLMQRYLGPAGTVLVFGGFACHAIAWALLYQPVQWHARSNVGGGADEPTIATSTVTATVPVVKGDASEELVPVTPAPSARCSFCQAESGTEAMEQVAAYDAMVMDTGTPMLSLTNDGWYSRTSLRSLYSSRHSLTTPRYLSLRPSMLNLSGAGTGPGTGPVVKDSAARKIDECHTEDCPQVQAEHEPLRRPQQRHGLAPQPPIIPPTTSVVTSKVAAAAPTVPVKPDAPDGRRTISAGEREVLKQASRRLEQLVVEQLHSQREQQRGARSCTCRSAALPLVPRVTGGTGSQPVDPDPGLSLTLLQRLVVFFDLDLLRDRVYVNIMVGITIANFAELNFSILTPFVLAEFGCNRHQIATAMSLLAATDICCRFLVPFIANRLDWQNRTFFLLGVCNMALGRIVLAHFHSYPVVLAVACWIGFNKGLRTVFMALAIPSHVPLDRLPGATGIHLLFAGIFYLLAGPLVGFVRDSTDYATTLHFLNLATYTMAISWCVEMYYLAPRRRKGSSS
ncbi:uncharacterized protein LOC118457713 [Anopheles albimanus]|uniref:uncharacterized protein LOC118457713 n=1 Tax=Anopheles albimanus TaxID=7167 RepID=UPI001641C146|nr:uncharacterized protein LOC118457713 [Anopheles albimanus]XP_035775403.1 uncharacterized protein LOC118457713 [Anopheles albimanus]